MKVYDRNLSGASAAATGRTSEAQASNRISNAADSANKGDGDRVELSSTLGELSRTLRAYSEQRSSIVQALAAQVQSGRYVTDSAAVSQRLIAETLAARAN